ncbi:conserved hypothetical protein [Heliomicrobium modesticaldum Ice1]|uniref:DUF2304 domain-containing protein n=1 Tax=Heliobacterium modesticaldum (strain ATCC 51547 / Ice1) TaxID=498761 RepID=B0THF8_HELMI|nr:DUF2304 domain-containing protein [Heliomicrobium modesticaldum]ABZ83396.1 conserved hypothetical protein [Heliomicrobium modesticaldum Ice1]
MSWKLIWFVRIVAAAFALYVIHKVKNNRLSEKESMYWLAGTLAILFLAIRPGLVDGMADYLGVAYQPALLFFLGILFILVILYRQASHISQLKESNKELAQVVAILDEEVRRLQGVYKTAAPFCGQAAPLCGEGAPSCGEAAPSCGEAAPLCGEAAPSCGEGAPSCGEGAPSRGGLK